MFFLFLPFVCVDSTAVMPFAVLVGIDFVVTITIIIVAVVVVVAAAAAATAVVFPLPFFGGWCQHLAG